MNRECYGEKFKVDDEWYWRCLMDGTFTKVDRHLKDGDICSTCKRPVYITEVKVDTRVRITQQICFKTNRHWLDFKNILILPG